VESFIADYVFDTAEWDALTSRQKEAAIREATRDIDSQQYLGSRYSSDQALEFPRSLDSASDEYARMKRDVQAAVALQALWVARNDGRNEHVERQAAGIVQHSESVGPIREAVTYAGSAVRRICSEAAVKLAMWKESRKVFRG
jgi:hypothetical protein